MEKTILIRQTEITFSIWDLGGIFKDNNYAVERKSVYTYSIKLNDRSERVCKYVAFGL